MKYSYTELYSFLSNIDNEVARIICSLVDICIKHVRFNWPKHEKLTVFFVILILQEQVGPTCEK